MSTQRSTPAMPPPRRPRSSKPSVSSTEPFRNVRDVPAGYGAALGCISGPEQARWGVHYVNPELAPGDVLLVRQKPEALIYEFKDGAGRLVGVEFIVFSSVLARHPRPEQSAGPRRPAASLHRQPQSIRTARALRLHVWAWRDNPNGAFVELEPPGQLRGAMTVMTPLAAGHRSGGRVVEGRTGTPDDRATTSFVGYTTD